MSFGRSVGGCGRRGEGVGSAMSKGAIVKGNGEFWVVCGWLWAPRRGGGICYVKRSHSVTVE